MARFCWIHVVCLVTYLVSTANSASTFYIEAIPKKRPFIEKLNYFVSLDNRGFRSVGSSVETLYGNFDLIGALEIDKVHSSVRVLESIEQWRKPVGKTPRPGVTTAQPDVTTSRPVVTTPQPVVTTPQPVVTTPQPVVTTPQPVVTTPQPAAATPTTACGDRWTKYGTSFFSFCTCTERCSFHSARNKCKEKQAELAQCTSRELENFFERLLNTSKYIFLGGNDLIEEGTWRWPDGSLLNASYTNWQSGQPDGGKRENCLEWYRPKRKWYDEACYAMYLGKSAGFVCEKKLSKVLLNH